MGEIEDASESKETWNRDHNVKKVMRRKNKSALGWRIDFASEHIFKKQRSLKRRQMLGAIKPES